MLRPLPQRPNPLRRLFWSGGAKDPSWIDLATSYGNPYVRDDVDASLSQQQLASWWELFHDDTLTELISLALENNKDLEAARSRLSEARAQVGIAESARLPWINLNGGWMRGNVPDHVVDGVLPEGPVRDQMGIDPQADGSFAGIDASWELDVLEGRKPRCGQLPIPFRPKMPNYMKCGSVYRLNWL